MVLLTGATGFVGRHIAARLVKEGWRVRCLVRDPARAPEFLRHHCELAQGDARDAEAAAQAAQGVEAIIHLIGIIRETKDARFEELHVGATVNLLQAAQRNGVRRFVQMSALGARADGPTPYLRTKWRGEEAVRASGLSYTIFRPSIIFGPEDEFINMLARLARRMPLLPRFGRGWMQPIWVEDVADCFVRSLKDELTFGRSFALGGPEVFTLDQIIELLCRLQGISKPRVKPPWPLLKLGARLIERFPGAPVTHDQLLMLEEDNTCDIGAMQGAFGIALRRLEDYLRELLGIPGEPAGAAKRKS